MKILNEDLLFGSNIENLTEEEFQMMKKEKMITEYLETGEGNGISVRPINEKINKNIDGKLILMENHKNDNI